MSLTVSFAVLLAALLHASWNAMIKGGNDVLLDTAAIVAGAGLVALPFVFLVPLPAPASWPYICASVATHVAYYYLMINAYRTGELSLVYPLMRGVAPLLTGVIAIFWMGEWPSAVGWAGMAMISLGVVALALRPARLGAALHGHGRAVGFALTNAGVIALYTIIDGSGARIAGNAWSYIVWLFVLDALPFTAYMLVTRGSTLRRGIGAAPHARPDRRGLVGGGLCDLGVGHDEGSGRTGGLIARNLRPVCNADRRAATQGASDSAPLGRCADSCRGGDRVESRLKEGTFTRAPRRQHTHTPVLPG